MLEDNGRIEVRFSTVAKSIDGFGINKGGKIFRGF